MAKKEKRGKKAGSLKFWIIENYRRKSFRSQDVLDL